MHVIKKRFRPSVFSNRPAYAMQVVANQKLHKL